jgi:hypothetical protein
MEVSNVIEIDFSHKLEIKINNQKPVVLTDLTMSLLGINQQYQRFIESETNQDYDASTELYIKEVRTGSIIVELVALTMPIVPLDHYTLQARAACRMLFRTVRNVASDRIAAANSGYVLARSSMIPRVYDNGISLEERGR